MTISTEAFRALCTARMDAIMDAVVDVFGVPREDIVKRSRWFEIMEARHAFYLVCYEVAKIRPEEIGTYLDRRDASTVRHALSPAEALRDTCIEWRRKYFAVVHRIDGGLTVCKHCQGVGLLTTGVHQGEKTKQSQEKVAKGCL